MSRIKKIFYKDRDYTVRELSEKYGVRIRTLRDRLRNGWNLEEALTTDINVKRTNQSPYVPSFQQVKRGKTYKIGKSSYVLDRVTKCAIGDLAIFKIVDTKSRESFTAVQLRDVGLELSQGV
jgi:uncharacterized protein YjcR